jgi:hypothetical protein
MPTGIDDTMLGEDYGSILPVVRKQAQGTGTVIVRLDATPEGIIWFLRELMIYPWPTPSAIIAGQAEIYIGEPAAFTLIDQSQQIPNTSPWGRGMMPLFATDSGITVQLRNVVSTQVVVASAIYEWCYADSALGLAVAQRPNLRPVRAGAEVEAHVDVRV